MAPVRYVICRQCRDRVRVSWRTGRLAEHWAANPHWNPQRGTAVNAVVRCGGSGTMHTLHEALPVNERPRATCPDCGRSVAVSTRGKLHRHACEAVSTAPAPRAPARRPTAGRAIRVRDDEE